VRPAGRKSLIAQARRIEPARHFEVPELPHETDRLEDEASGQGSMRRMRLAMWGLLGIALKNAPPSQREPDEEAEERMGW
jgi:hypothetical protein